MFAGFPIQVAGKTGTAENFGGTDHGWFVAYAPYEHPRIVIAVLVEQGGFGSVSAGPIVRSMLEEFFHIGTYADGAKNTNGTPAASNQADANNDQTAAQNNN